MPFSRISDERLKILEDDDQDESFILLTLDHGIFIQILFCNGTGGGDGVGNTTDSSELCLEIREKLRFWFNAMMNRLRTKRSSLTLESSSVQKTPIPTVQSVTTDIIEDEFTKDLPWLQANPELQQLNALYKTKFVDLIRAYERDASQILQTQLEVPDTMECQICFDSDLKRVIGN